MSEPLHNFTSVGAYRSFLVRLWQSHAEGRWHASAQSIQTGVTLHFADLAALYTFLETQTASSQGDCITDDLSTQSLAD